MPVRPQSIKTKYKQEIQALKRAKLAHERRLQEEKQLRQLAKERKKVEQELQKLKKEQEEKQLELLQTQREQQGHPLATIPQGLARANPSIQTTYPPKPIIPAVANCFNNYQRSPALPTLPLSAIPSLMSGAINAYSTITAPSISSGVSPTSTTTAPTPSLSKDSAHPSTTHWVRPSPVGPETKPPPPPTPPTQESLRSHEGEPSPSDQTVKTSNHRRNGSLPAFAAAAGGMTSMATQYVTPLPNVKTLPVVTHHHDEPSQLPANAPTMTGPPLATSPESSGSLVDGPADAPEPVVKRQEIHPSLATSVAQQGVNKNSYIPSGGAGAASILVATAFGGGGGDARPSDGTMVATALKQYSQQTLPHSTQAYLTEQLSSLLLLALLGTIDDTACYTGMVGNSFVLAERRAHWAARMRLVRKKENNNYQNSVVAVCRNTVATASRQCLPVAFAVVDDREMIADDSNTFAAAVVPSAFVVDDRTKKHLLLLRLGWTNHSEERILVQFDKA